MVNFRYKIIKTGSGYPKRFAVIISEFVIGDTISSDSLFQRHKEELLQKHSKPSSVKSVISQAMVWSKKQGIIERYDELSVPKWFEELKTVHYWQAQLRGSRFKNLTRKNANSTKTQYLYHLWNFNKWLSDKTFEVNMLVSSANNTFVQNTEKRQFENIEELFLILEQPFAEKKNVTRIVKQYLLDDIHRNKKASYVMIIKNAIRSYFDKNEQPLQISFNPKTHYSTETEYEQSMSVSELMEFLTTGKPSILEKTVFLCKFHRGLDVSTLVDRFNYEAWEQMVQWFGSENHNSWDLEKCPVPISLTRIKTDYKHVGFLEQDAVEQLQKYLDFRKAKTGNGMENNQPLFLNKFGRPITVEWILSRFSSIAKRAGIQKSVETNGRKQYKMDSHELRDLLKSTLIDSGCRIDVADHVIGHKPKDSYEKQAKLYPETLRKEYAKASKRLNMFTKFTSVVNGTDDSDELRLELKENMAQMESLRNDLIMEKAVKDRDRMFADRQREIMREMQREIDELKSGTDHRTQENTEFCCAQCSTIHSKKSCPACNSKLKRIYEDKVQN